MRLILLCCCCLVLDAVELDSANGLLKLTLPAGWEAVQTKYAGVQTARSADRGNNLVLYQSKMPDAASAANMVERDMTDPIAAEFRQLYPAARVVRSTYRNGQETVFTIYTAVLGAGYAIKTNVVFCADEEYLYKLILTMTNDGEAKGLLEGMLATVALGGEQ